MSDPVWLARDSADSKLVDIYSMRPRRTAAKWGPVTDWLGCIAASRVPFPVDPEKPVLVRLVVELVEESAS